VTATERAVELTVAAAEAADEKLAQNIVAFDVSDHLAITDVFLVCSANNERQVAAIVDGIERRLREEKDMKPLRREGDKENRWVLLDYFDIVVHVQDNEERAFYDLERLWKDCPTIALPDSVGTPSSSVGEAAGGTS
jgi:ribosome-associated protein